MSLKRALRRIGKVVKKVAPIAAVAGLGFVAGPAGAGAAARIIGGLGRIGKAGIKAAPQITRAVAPMLQQRQVSSPMQMEATQPVQSLAFQSAALPPLLREPSFGAPFTATPIGGTMSLLPQIVRAGVGLARRYGPSIAGGIAGGLSSQLPALPGAGFKTGGTLESFPLAPGGGVMRSGYRFDARTGTWKKRRRMNTTNVHALRRALRRVEGFVKLEKRVDKIVNRAARSSRGARAHGFVRSKAKR